MKRHGIWRLTGAAAAGLAAAGGAATAHGQETLTYSYDVHGRLTTVQRAGGPSSGMTSRHGHDMADNRADLWIGTGTPPAAPAPRPPRFSVTDAAANEGEPLVFTIHRHGSIATSYTLNYATAGGTATSGTDFTPASGTLTFGPDDYVRTVSIATIEDAAFEANETLSLDLSGASGGAVIVDAQGVGTILNDDSSNQSPVAVEDNAEAEACGPRVVVNVVANDYDPDGNTPLAVSAIQSVSGGNAFIVGTTSISFKASPAGGIGAVVYTVQDSLGATANGTLVVQISGQGPCS